MGFTKEEAVNEITAKFSKEVKDINLWERTIQENVESLYPLVEGNEEIDVQGFADKVLPLLRTTLGFMRKTNADVAKQKENEVKALQEELQAIKSTKPNVQEPNNEDDRISKLEDGLSRLLGLYEQQENARRIEIIKESLFQKVLDKGVKNQDWVKAMIGKIAINPEMDLDKESQDIVAIYNSFKADIPVDVTPNQSSNGKSSLSSIIEAANKTAELREEQ